MKKVLTLQNVTTALFIIIAIISSFLSAKSGGDFDVFLDAASKLKQGQNIYGPPYIKGLQYYYSVFFALLLVPFSSFIFLSEFLWLLLSYALLYRIWILTKVYFNISELTKKQYILWTALILFYSIQFLIYNIRMIQVTIFLLWGCLEALKLVQNKKEIWGGMLLAILINIKMMPLLLFPYLLYRGYFKSIIVAILFFVFLLFVPGLLIGVDYNNFLLVEWWKIINPTNTEHVFETGIGPHSLSALLPVYLMPMEATMPFKRNILNLQPESVEIIINLVRLFLLGISLFFFHSAPFKKEDNKLKTFWEVSYFLMLVPLLMPHQQKYAFLFVIPMLGYIIFFFISTWKRKKTVSYWVCFVCFILLSLMYSPLYGSDIIGRSLFNYLQHYRVLTIVTLFFIPIALYCKPRKIILS